MFFLDSSFSQEFEELRTVVTIIDEEYKTKWITTAIPEKIQFFSKSEFKTVLDTLPNLRNPAGFNLVRFHF